MNNRLHSQICWLRKENFSGAFSAGGALSFPVFMLMASLSMVMISGIYQPADALVRAAPIEFAPLQPLVVLTDDLALAAGLEEEMRNSAVADGSWQPADKVAKPASATPEETPVMAESRAIVPPSIQPVVALQPIERTLEPPTIHPVVTLPVSTVQKVASVTKRAATVNLNPTKRLARQSLRDQSPAAAYRLLMAKLEAGATDTEFLGLLAVAALASGKAGEAQLIYERLVVLEPDREQWWAGLAVSRDRIGLDAGADYRRALAFSEDGSAVSRLVRSRLQETG